MEGEVAGKIAVGIGLGEEVFGLLLDFCDRVRSCDEPPRRLLQLGEGAERGGELGGISALLAVHPAPGGHGGGCSVGVVVDRQLWPDR